MAMHAVRFTTSIGEDQTIRPPLGVRLAPGQAEVIVLQPDEAAKYAVTPSLPLPERLANAAKELGINDLPKDLAENHDHYVHGTSKQIDQP
jgi:hypothetical protein